MSLGCFNAIAQVVGGDEPTLAQAGGKDVSYEHPSRG